MADIKKTTAAISLTGLVSASVLFGVLDQRYAQASDVEAVVQSVQEERIERIEFMIGSANRRILYIRSLPSDRKTEWDKQQLIESEMEKEFLIRKLERIDGKH